MKTLDIINKRVSIRKFNLKPINSESMDNIIKAAIQVLSTNSPCPWAEPYSCSGN